MAFEIEWLESAEREFDAEMSYVLEEFGFAAARNAYLRLQRHVSQLADFPLIGTVYQGVTYQGCEIRKLPIRQVTVFYSPQEDKVTVLAVWNNHKAPDNIKFRLSEEDE